MTVDDVRNVARKIPQDSITLRTQSSFTFAKLEKEKMLFVSEQKPPMAECAKSVTEATAHSSHIPEPDDEWRIAGPLLRDRWLSLTFERLVYTSIHSSA